VMIASSWQTHYILFSTCQTELRARKRRLTALQEPAPNVRT